MEPRISLITLGVADLHRALEFYRDGLHLPTTWTSERGVVFFQTTGTCLSLYPFEKLAEDIGESWSDERKSRFPGITLAHNVREKDQVDLVLMQAESAGGKIEKPAHDTFWGGYSGYFSDLDGYLWEVAYGAFEFNDDGSLNIT